MGRCGVQSYLLYHLVQSNDYEYALGRTYVGSISLLIPRSVWPDRPPNKRQEGTEALFGSGSHVPGEFEVTWLYGLAGETMLNFGPLAVPFAFAVLGTFLHAGVQYSHWFGQAVPDVSLPHLLSLCALVVMLLLITSTFTRPALYTAGLVALPIATGVLLLEWILP